MFVYWKIPYELTVCEPANSDLNNISAKNFSKLTYSLGSINAPVSGEKLLEYMAEYPRDEIFNSVSLEDVIRMAYDKFVRQTFNLSGSDYLNIDRAHCDTEQLEQLHKIAINKDKLHTVNYKGFIPLCESAIFEICRRNDAELFRIYLDEFDGYCPSEIYDAVFDYFIYMYLPDWSLLKQFNKENNRGTDDLPGACYEYPEEHVSKDIQKKLLDIINQQADKCKIPRPEVLEILFQHNISSYRQAFPLKEQSVHLGMEFSNRNSDYSMYAQRILFHYDDKELSPTNCINPHELNDLLKDSTFALPVTCTCGDEGCGGIRAVSESWVIGKKVRLYISDDSYMYFFEIADRTALRSELLLMLKYAIRTLQYHKRCQKNGEAPPCDDDELPFLPYRTTLSSLQKLCKDIADDLQTEK